MSFTPQSSISINSLRNHRQVITPDTRSKLIKAITTHKGDQSEIQRLVQAYKSTKQTHIQDKTPTSRRWGINIDDLEIKKALLLKGLLKELGKQRVSVKHRATIIEWVEAAWEQNPSQVWTDNSPEAPLSASAQHQLTYTPARIDPSAFKKWVSAHGDKYLSNLQKTLLETPIQQAEQRYNVDSPEIHGSNESLEQSTNSTTSINQIAVAEENLNEVNSDRSFSPSHNPDPAPKTNVIDEAIQLPQSSIAAIVNDRQFLRDTEFSKIELTLAQKIGVGLEILRTSIPPLLMNEKLILHIAQKNPDGDNLNILKTLVSEACHHALRLDLNAPRHNLNDVANTLIGIWAHSDFRTDALKKLTRSVCSGPEEADFLEILVRLHPFTQDNNEKQLNDKERTKWLMQIALGTDLNACPPPAAFPANGLDQESFQKLASFIPDEDIPLQEDDQQDSYSGNNGILGSLTNTSFPNSITSPSYKPLERLSIQSSIPNDDKVRQPTLRTRRDAFYNQFYYDDNSKTFKLITNPAQSRPLSDGDKFALSANIALNRFDNGSRKGREEESERIQTRETLVTNYLRYIYKQKSTLLNDSLESKLWDYEIKQFVSQLVTADNVPQNLQVDFIYRGETLEVAKFLVKEGAEAAAELVNKTGNDKPKLGIQRLADILVCVQGFNTADERSAWMIDFVGQINDLDLTTLLNIKSGPNHVLTPEEAATILTLKKAEATILELADENYRSEIIPRLGADALIEIINTEKNQLKTFVNILSNALTHPHFQVIINGTLPELLNNKNNQNDVNQLVDLGRSIAGLYDNSPQEMLNMSSLSTTLQPVRLDVKQLQTAPKPLAVAYLFELPSEKALEILSQEGYTPGFIGQLVENEMELFVRLISQPTDQDLQLDTSSHGSPVSDRDLETNSKIKNDDGDDSSSIYNSLAVAELKNLCELEIYKDRYKNLLENEKVNPKLAGVTTRNGTLNKQDNISNFLKSESDDEFNDTKYPLDSSYPRFSSIRNIEVNSTNDNEEKSDPEDNNIEEKSNLDSTQTNKVNVITELKKKLENGSFFRPKSLIGNECDPNANPNDLIAWNLNIESEISTISGDSHQNESQDENRNNTPNLDHQGIYNPNNESIISTENNPFSGN